MKRILENLLIVTLVTVVEGKITGTNPPNGACLCFSGTSVNIRSTACGIIIGSENSGQCYKYKGSKQGCNLDKYYEFFKIDWNGRDGWAAGEFLDLASDSRCGSGPQPPAGNEYTCEVRDQGKRIHETLSRTSFDCRDSRCQNTCRGGQCVAYVTCSCKRNGKWAPNTSCWKPGRKIRTPDGKCNRNIPRSTAIATFNSQGNYVGHAAVFIRCKDDYSVEVYDQWCGRSVDYSTYPSTHSFYNNFATITSAGCTDRASWPCRVENSGPTVCPASSSCKRSVHWWKATDFEDNISD